MDLSELQGLLAQFQPTPEERAAANKQGILAASLGLLGARRGQEFDRLGQAGLLGLQAQNGALQQMIKDRQANLQGAAQLSDMMRQANFANMFMPGARPNVGGAPSMPGASAPPAMPGGAPPAPPTAPPSAPASPLEQLRNMGVPDVAIMTAATSKDPQGAIAALIKEYSQPVFGQGKIPLMRGPGGSFKAVVPEGFNQALASQVGAETTAQKSAEAPFDTIDVPDGRGGIIKMPKDQALQVLRGAAQGPQINFNLQNQPPNERAAMLADIARGPGANMPAGPSLGIGRTPSPLDIKAGEAAISTQAAQNTDIAQGFGKDYVDMVKAEKSAPANIQKYNHLKDLYSQVETGKLANSVQGLKQIAAYVAPDLAKSWTGDVPYAQAAAALSNAMALELRNPAGGAGMPGSLSDADRQYLQSMISSIQNDPRSIPMILDAKIALEKRNADMGRIARQYRAQNGGKLDEGVYEAFQNYSNSHPLFTQQQAATAAGVPDRAALEAEMRRRGLLK